MNAEHGADPNGLIMHVFIQDGPYAFPGMRSKQTTEEEIKACKKKQTCMNKHELKNNMNE